MVIKNDFLYIVIVFFLVQVTISNTLFAQSSLTNNDCINQVAPNIESLACDLLSDSLYIEYEEKGTYINFRFVNTKPDTLYLFSSYFSKVFHSSKYIHRIDKEKHRYLVSFLPIIPYLSTKLDDRVIIGKNKIVNKNQILYEFIEMKPNSYFDLKINYENLFKNITGEKNFVSNFNVKEKNKFDTIKFKYISINKLKGKYNLFFEFAVYRKVNLLCKQSAYYLKEAKFNQQAKSFMTLRIPVEIKNYTHPLIK